MRTDWLSDDVMQNILAALTPQNRLAVTVSLVTGMRIGDALRIRLVDAQRGRFTYTEEKTFKHRTVRLPGKLADALIANSGKVWCFEHRIDARKHRTRQAVFKDIKRAAKAFRVRLNVAPHSARKIYAVKEYHKDMNIRRVKELLNHSSEAVTMIYALADEITARGQRGRCRCQGREARGE